MNRKKVVAAVGSGLLLTLAYPHFDFYGLAWFALVPLFWAAKGGTDGQRFSTGLIAGLTHYLSLLYWLVNTMTFYGRLPEMVSAALLLLLAAYLALYFAVFAYALGRFQQKPSLAFFCFVPALWTALEYVRMYLFSGFPWELLGYSQYRLLPLIQMTDLTGVYGVSFLVAMANGGIFLVLLFALRADWQGRQVQGRMVIAATSLMLLCLTGVWTYGEFRIRATDQAAAVAQQKKISVIQGNVDQAVKWDPAFQVTTIAKYNQLSETAAEEKPDLMVWPETATPFYFLTPHERKLNRMVQAGIRKAGTYFLIGSPSYVRTPEQLDYFNSAYLLNPLGYVLGKYDKVHLVPYGEYVPLKKWFPFVGKMVAEIGDFKSGEMGATLAWEDAKLGMLICFEGIFPDLARAMTKNQADLLINITNDAWFGKTSAPYQHLSMTVFRAVENKRCLVRSANTGISGFIDPVGRCTAATPLFEDAVLTRTVPLLKIRTIYSQVGDVFALACLVGVLLFIARRYTKNKIAN